ncbi:MAG TPA: hypothetical protein VFW28_16545 [Micropepsaceae bacterium]|nr:hypothetical protein [Micropepsaceae bacterium]
MESKGYTHHASADDPKYEIRAARPSTLRCIKVRR